MKQFVNDRETWNIMMNYVFAGMILVAAAYGVFSGNGSETAAAMLQSGIVTARLMITVAGSMTMWCGVMAIAEKAGVTGFISRLLRPLLRHLMPDLAENAEAEKFVCMNVAANLMGLGNAATPPGLKAMRAMARAEGNSARATRDMVTFAVMNTASIQLIPTTVMTLRSAAGSADPAGIIRCVWITSAAALAVGLIICRIYGKGQGSIKARQL